MGNLKEAFDRAQLIAAESAARRATERAKGQPLPPKAEVLSNGLLQHGVQLQCLDPWLIVRVVSRSEPRAAAALERDGNEVFYPVGRHIDRLPQRFIPPKKRKHNHGFLRVDVRNPYPGYVFARRLVGKVTPDHFAQLDGVIGACKFSEDALATIADWRVEMLRVAQDCGDFDYFDPVISAKEFNLAEFRYTPSAAKRWSLKPRVVARLDSNRGAIHYVEEFGRITRVVAAAGDQDISSIVDATAP